MDENKYQISNGFEKRVVASKYFSVVFCDCRGTFQSSLQILRGRNTISIPAVIVQLDRDLQQCT
jgi:hypothetical protein